MCCRVCKEAFAEQWCMQMMLGSMITGCVPRIHAGYKSRDLAELKALPYTWAPQLIAFFSLPDYGPFPK